MRQNKRLRTVALVLSVGLVSTFTELPAKNPIRNFTCPAASFEANRGQMHADVRYRCRLSGYTFFFTENEAVFSLGRTCPGEEPRSPSVLRMTFPTALSAVEPQGREPRQRRSHYFVGNVPEQWVRDVPHYGEIFCRDLFPGIDLEFYLREGALEYDFHIAPGADPGDIEIFFDGADGLEVDDDGHLRIRVDDVELLNRRPVIFQEREGERVPIEGRFVVQPEGASIRFEVADFDSTRRLVIDPVVLYATYHGGASNDQSSDVVIDTTGNAYVTGFTRSDPFPTTSGDRPTAGPEEMAFVSKINPTGTELVYSIYFGGQDGSTRGAGIALDSLRRPVIAGRAQSTDLPVVNAFQGSFGGLRDAFFAKFDARGNDLLFSSYLGGIREDEALGLCLDQEDNLYLTGFTDGSFPIENNFDDEGGSGDAFAAKFDSSGQSLVYSTYIAGESPDTGRAIAADINGNAYITGETNSGAEFPIQDPVPDGDALNGIFADAFVTKLDPSGDLLFSTYLGGPGEDSGRGIAVSDDEQIYVTGTAAAGFPIENPLVGDGVPPVFVARVQPNMIEYSSFFLEGAATSGGGRDIALDDFNNVYVTGSITFAPGVTLESIETRVQLAHGGSDDAFLLKISSDDTNVPYASFFGGTGSDAGLGVCANNAGEAFIAGTTTGNFPIPSPNVIEDTAQGGVEGFVAGITTTDDDRIPFLEYDVPVAITMGAPSRVFRLPTYLGDSVRISMTPPGFGFSNSNFLYVKFDRKATRSDFDFAGLVRNSAAQRVSIPYAPDGTAFILIQTSSPGFGNNLEILATRDDLQLTSFSVSSAARGTTITGYVRGTGFTDDIQFDLESPTAQTTITGRNLSVSRSIAHVEFTLTPLAEVGPYSLRVSNPDNEDLLADVLDVSSTDTGELLDIRVSGPDIHRITHIGHFNIKYTNFGTTEIPAPMILVVAPKDTHVFLPSNPDYKAQRLLIFGKSPEGPAGRLPASGVGSINVGFQIKPRDLSPRDMPFRVYAFEPVDGQYVNWDTLDVTGVFSPAGWENVVGGLSRLGATWKDYHTNLANISTRIGQRGLDASSARLAFRLATGESLGQNRAAIRGQLFDFFTGSPLADTQITVETSDVLRTAFTNTGGFFTLDCLAADQKYKLAVPGHALVDPRVSTLPAEGPLGFGTDQFVAQLVAGPTGSDFRALDGVPCDDDLLPENPFIPPLELFTEYPGYEVRVSAAIDPNEKDGPEGEGPLHIIGNSEPMDYTISFENAERVTGGGGLIDIPNEGWAQEVVIRDTLPSELLFRTFERGTLTLLPAGESSQPISVDLARGQIASSGVSNTGFNATVVIRNVRPATETNYNAVLCDLSYDDIKGEIVWWLSSRDPITFARPPATDPSEGFLAPGGEGHVSFRLEQRPNLADGTDIRNDVTITFQAGDQKETEIATSYTNQIGGPALPARSCVPNDTFVRLSRQNENNGRLFTWRDPLGRGESFDVYLWASTGDPKNPPPRPTSPESSFPVPFFIPPPLNPGLTYFWQVVSHGRVGPPAEGPLCRFRVVSPTPSPSSPPILEAPLDQQVVSITPTFRWQPGSGARSHAIRVWEATDPNFTPVFLRPSLAGNEITVTSAEALRPGTEYRWVVTALSLSLAPASPPWRFRTASTSAMSDFTRGDTNNDESIAFVDVMALLFVLYGGLTTNCEDSLDINDDGRLDTTDAIFFLQYLFLDGAPPREPFPEAGPDPSPNDVLGCDR